MLGVSGQQLGMKIFLASSLGLDSGWELSINSSSLSL